ncbi:MAG TPA: amino acid synthesis family protein [Ferrovibrio sp.]|uniref:amino acid synthesis family protein n=1 Tax=Ferrovibrio sp. TaxID=1917215 RepID=UPI002ED116C2
MSLVEVRKIVLSTEEIFHEGGPKAAKPPRRGAIGAVLRNPYAGRYETDITPMMEALKPLGIDLSKRLVAALGGDPKAIEAYGKGSIVGAGGELEHGALWHVPGGYSMREVLGGAKAIVPSSTKVGGVGCRIDIPLHHINAAYVRSHFDAFEFGVPDGPRDNEILFILAMSTGPRVHHRVGGLQASEIRGEDGLR